MITEFVERFEANKDKLREKWSQKAPVNYKEIVESVIELLGDEDKDGTPDPKRVHQIDDGDYQGTLVFVIAARGYQPMDYWYVMVSYGSCSGCDALQAIYPWNDETPQQHQVDGYMTLALHVIQGLKEM